MLVANVHDLIPWVLDVLRGFGEEMVKLPSVMFEECWRLGKVLGNCRCMNGILTRMVLQTRGILLQD